MTGRFLMMAGLLAMLGTAGCGGGDEQALPEGMVELASATADLTASGRMDTVRLLGRPTDAGGAFHEDFTLLASRSPRTWALPNGAASGYSPQLSLADVTGDGRPEALVSADTGGSGGMIAAAVVMVVAHGDGWRFRNVFDVEAGPAPELVGGFVAGEAAELEVRAPGLPPRQETLDLRGRYTDLGDQSPFDTRGAVRTPVQLWGGAVMAVSAVTLDDGRPALRLVQQVRGVSNADRLAEVTTDLVWERATWTTAGVVVRPLP